jgi:hypothetical protein
MLRACDVWWAFRVDVVRTASRRQVGSASFDGKTDDDLGRIILLTRRLSISGARRGIWSTLAAALIAAVG